MRGLNTLQCVLPVIKSKRVPSQWAPSRRSSSRTQRDVHSLQAPPRSFGTASAGCVLQAAAVRGVARMLEPRLSGPQGTVWPPG